jgi:hypothetical protein
MYTKAYLVLSNPSVYPVSGYINSCIVIVIAGMYGSTGQWAVP